MSQITKTHLYITNKKALTEIRSIGLFHLSMLYCYAVSKWDSLLLSSASQLLWMACIIVQSLNWLCLIASSLKTYLSKKLHDNQSVSHWVMVARDRQTDKPRQIPTCLGW